MRDYDPAKPLIFIHVPKTAGTSVRNIVEGWFPGRFHTNYFNEVEGSMPAKLPAEVLADSVKPPVIYGHFNQFRGFGVADYYPQVSQFVTILRDPFEATVSRYFFLRKVSGKWKDRSGVPESDLEDFLGSADPMMLNHFPKEVTMQNFREVLDQHFVELGITECLSESLGRIADKLGVAFEANALCHANATERDQPVPRYLRDAFVAAHPLEYAVYDYARSRYEVR